ncbi:helix-turn-helix domain-containing protein [Shimazuella kribbensis]|uniref:helix-turn-helix domain-containing protein n=1 Tax=Shimazuella kribbensis TaxID=139808 RepID=UPI000402C845|nr:helix-turn-helix transcriptional regulator [Shimazuella kribbensis]
MEQIDPIKLGKFLRQKRKELGYRIEDLEDKEISSATISNIERGKSTLKSDKIPYLCQKLNINPPGLHKLINTNQSRKNLIKQRLQGLDAIIEFDTDYVLQQLEEISLTNLDSLSSYVEFLKGKVFQYKRSWTNAKNHFIEGIEIVNRNKALRKTNLKTICLTQLGKLYYFNNNPEQALEYVNEALKEFQPDGEKQESKHIALISKAIYLDEIGKKQESLGKKQESLQVINILLEDTSKITNIDVLLNAYELKGSLLRRLQLPQEALHCVLEGLNIAKSNSMFIRSVELWTELGKIYLDLREIEEAKCVLETAIRFEPVVPKQFFLVAYTTLGNVYMMDQDWEISKQYFQTVIELITPDTPVTKYIDAYIGLADCYMFLAQHEQAMDTYQYALQKCREFGLRNKENYVSIKLCECAKKSDQRLFYTYLEDLFYVQKQLSEIKR